MNLFALVKASPECTVLIGEDPVRFFEFGEAPELETLPYATHQFITGTPYNLLDGPASADHLSIQIDVWANSSTECKAVANAIRSATEGHCYVTSWLGTSKESGVFRSSFTIQLIDLR
jgi:hypothetical protein